MVGGSPGTPASFTTKTGRHDIAESGVKHNKLIYIAKMSDVSITVIYHTFSKCSVARDHFVHCEFGTIDVHHMVHYRIFTDLKI